MPAKQEITIATIDLGVVSGCIWCLRTGFCNLGEIAAALALTM